MARVVIDADMLVAAQNGKRIIGVMARTQDGWFGQAVTQPASLHVRSRAQLTRSMWQATPLAHAGRSTA